MKRHSIFWGVIVIAGGVLLLLNALGIGSSFDLVPALGSLVLLAVSIASFAELNFVFGLLPLSVITFLWRDKIGIPDLQLWPILLAALLLGIGLSIIFGRFKKHKFEKCWEGHSHGEFTTSESITSGDENEFVNIESTFGEATKYIRSSNLKKVSIESSFSTTKVYFDQCQLSPEGASIYVDCNFASVILYIPRTWNIDNQAHAAFGSVDGASMSSGDFVKVTLIGEVHFGSVMINYI